jgi:quinol monooxygenase YgiN
LLLPMVASHRCPPRGIWKTVAEWTFDSQFENAGHVWYNDRMIHVIATIELTAGARAAFLVEFWSIVPSVLAEPGCLEYGPTVDVPTEIPAQGPPRDDVVVIVEKWRDLECLRSHLTAPHMVAYRPKVKHLVIRSQLQVLTAPPMPTS